MSNIFYIFQHFSRSEIETRHSINPPLPDSQNAAGPLALVTPCMVTEMVGL
jgi:hypothetical protein